MMIVNHIKTIQNAWFQKILVDFRAWYFPKTEQGEHWKNRELHKAIRVCPSRMMDDAEEMLKEYRKNNNQQGIVATPDKQIGTSSYLPIMLTATATLDGLPQTSQILGVPYLNDVNIQGNIVRMRIEPIAMRCQVAFFATNPFDVRDVLNQFCTYMTDDAKRMFYVPFVVGHKDGENIYEKFRFTVFENELYPSTAGGEALNMYVGTVDVTLCGCIPHVIGLGMRGEDKIDGGFDNKGMPLPTPLDDLDKVVIQVDGYDVENWRIKADRETGERIVEKGHE